MQARTNIMTEAIRKRIVIVRHGHALSAGEAGVYTDYDRPLSERGRRGAAFSAGKLADLGIKPSLVLASPLVRAQQTAEIVAGTFSVPVETARELSGEYDLPELWLAVSAAARKSDCLVVVGHQPQMGLLAGVLLGEQGMHLSPGGFISLLSGADWPSELACGAVSAELLMLAPKEE